MCAEGIEVGIECLHIDLDMGHALCAIYGKGYIVLVGDAYHLTDGVDRTQHVGHVSDRHQAGAFIEELHIFIHADFALVGDGYHTQADALALLEQLPRHDVAMVLHGGHDDLVALVQEGLAKRRCQQIESLGGATREDNLTGRGGIDKRTHALARGLVQFGGLL